MGCWAQISTTFCDAKTALWTLPLKIEEAGGHCGASNSPDHFRARTPTGTRVRIRPAVISRSHSPPLLSISFPVQTFTVLSHYRQKAPKQILKKKKKKKKNTHTR